ncbi:YnbE family lipoprotein [Brevundimonas sp.]|uniref:YnbE family lipoprotein n=1 Tax=Brevundimonas sp. TaxID=1871086 RepID=UPI002FD9F0ED
MSRTRATTLTGLALIAAAAGSVAACTPTVRVEVAPIQIYAKLDADVRIRLDRELQQLLQENPNLF